MGTNQVGMHRNRSRIAPVLLLGAIGFAGNGWCAYDALLPASQAVAQEKSAQDKKGVIDEQTLRDLIKLLGDDSFAKREAADKQLAAIGEPALELLQKAALENADAEVRQRAGLLVQGINKSLFFQVSQGPSHKNVQGPRVSRVAVTADGRLALSMGTDGLRSWDLVNGKQALMWDRKGGYCWGLALSADGKRVIMGCSGKQAHVFDAESGKRVQKPVNHNGPVWGVALSADGKQAVSGGEEKGIRVWDVATGKVIRAFDGVVDEIRCLALSPDGKQVAAGHFVKANQPGTVRLWDVASGKEIRAFNGHKLEISSVAFSPDGKILSSTSFDKTVRLWEVATGKELKVLAGHKGRVEYAAFTPDGKRIVSCSSQNNPSLRLWDVATGKQLLETVEMKGGFFCVAVLPDGQRCVSAGGDGVVRLWRWKR